MGKTRLTLKMDESTVDLLRRLAGGERQVSAFVSTLVHRLAAGAQLVDESDFKSIDETLTRLERQNALNQTAQAKLEAQLLALASRLPDDDEARSALTHAHEVLTGRSAA